MKRTTQDDKTEKVGITLPLPIVLIKQIEKAQNYGITDEEILNVSKFLNMVRFESAAYNPKISHV
jgi:hypothetical protein